MNYFWLKMTYCSNIKKDYTNQEILDILEKDKYIGINSDDNNANSFKTKLKIGDYGLISKGFTGLYIVKIDSDFVEDINKNGFDYRFKIKLILDLKEVNLPGQGPQDALVFNGKNINTEEAFLIKKLKEIGLIMTKSQLKIIDNSKNLLNKKKQIILYGPAGTGKTYNTKSIIVNHNSNESILDKTEVDKKYQELKDQGRIKFVTFHQSFAYEDFIEGIKPKTENCNVSYETLDGIFKELSITAININNKLSDKNEIIYNFDEDNLNKGYEKLLEEIRKSKDNKLELETLSRRQKFKISVNSKGNLNLYTGNEFKQQGVLTRNRILTLNIGYPGWESYFNAVNSKIKELVSNENQEITTDLGSNTLTKNLLKDFYDKTKKERNDHFTSVEPYYLIIDEINRGNISKIFGELITLLEASKRLGQDDELTTTLPYSKEEFGIPPNLYIIGTMNTSDKSIAHLDIALRRRFGFVEMLPDYDVISEDENNTCRKLLKELNHRIQILLDKDHLIGHSLFVGKSEDDISQIMQYEIVPLLEEYFYGDYEKIQTILGKNNLIYKEEELGDYTKNIYKYWFENKKEFDSNLNDEPKVDQDDK